MRILEHVVTRDQENRTVKSIALKEMRLSRGQFSSLKFSGGITVDGQPSRADVRLRAGQRLRATLREEGSPALIPYDLPVRIVYEDADYWVIDKPAPLPTLCSARQEGPTLEKAREEGICVLQSDKTAFELCALMAQSGLPGTPREG